MRSSFYPPALAVSLRCVGQVSPRQPVETQPKQATTACSLPGVGSARPREPGSESPLMAPAAMLALPSLQPRARRSAGHRPAWRPPAPLRAATGPCPSAPSAPSHWLPCHEGPPIYNGVYHLLLKGAAVRLNHTAASGPRRLARLLAWGASSHWPKHKSISRRLPPIGLLVCQSLSPSSGALPDGWLAELPLSSPPAFSRL